MSFPGINTRHYTVEIFTEHFFFNAELEPFGTLAMYLNQVDRYTYTFRNVTGYALDPASLVQSVRAEELFIQRKEIVAIGFAEKLSNATFPLMSVKEVLRVFLPHFVVQGTFFRGPDGKTVSIFDITGQWVGCHNVKLHHILPIAHGVPTEAHTLLINKDHIRFYKAVTE